MLNIKLFNSTSQTLNIKLLNSTSQILDIKLLNSGRDKAFNTFIQNICKYKGKNKLSI